MTSARKWRVILSAIAFVFLASESLAQFRGGGPGRGERGAGRAGAAGATKNPDQAVRPARADLFEQLLENLQDDLKLSREQMNAWASYADKVRALASDIARERQRGEATMKMNVLQRVDHSVDVARDRLTAMEDIASAVKALYAVLTPEQRLTADPRLATLVPFTDGIRSGNSPGGTARQKEPRKKDD